LTAGPVRNSGHSLKQFFQQAVGNGALDNQIKQIMIEQNLKRQHNFISDMKKQMVKLERNFNHDQEHIDQVKKMIRSVDHAPAKG